MNIFAIAPRPASCMLALSVCMKPEQIAILCDGTRGDAC